jgi:putative glycosyltransferase (TIGR04372 family)
MCFRRDSARARIKRIFFALYWRICFARAAITLSFILLLKLVLSPWVKVRIGVISQDRIGHFAFDVAHYLAHRPVPGAPPTCLDFFFLVGYSCNTQIVKMAKRNLRVVGTIKNTTLIAAFSKRFPNSFIRSARQATRSRDLDLRVSGSPPTLKFSADENRIGQAYLRKQNLAMEDKWICLLVRDDEYLKHINEKVGSKKDWSYHSYRNSNVESFRECINTMTALGYHVFRMGKHVQTPFPSKGNRKLVDYATSTERSDFLDIWLMANCSFCISTGAGLDSVGVIFHRPISYINFLPLTDDWISHRSIVLPKALSWKSESRGLSLEEYLRTSYHNTDEYVSAGIQIEPANSSEIASAVLEMHEAVNVERKGSVFLDDEQREAMRIMQQSKWFQQLSGKIHPDARFSRVFLTKCFGRAL